MLENKWALVVDDDAHSLVAISSMLRDLGIRFKRNTTGAKVPEQMRSMNPPPDFVLLNVDLPHGSAFTINRTIQADPAVRGIPVIAIGTGDSSPLRQQAQHSGFASYLAKPLPRRQFGTILQRILSGEHVWESAYQARMHDQ